MNTTVNPAFGFGTGSKNQPLVTSALDALNLIRAGNTLGPIRVLRLALKNNPDDAETPLAFRMRRAMNWLENGQVDLAVGVLTGNL